MRRLSIIPLVIWLGGCSLFLYDSASFGIAGADKSGISASVMPHPDALYANDRVRVTLSNEKMYPMYYSTNSAIDPTNQPFIYTNALVFSNMAPFTLYARVQYLDAPWGGLLTRQITGIADGSAAHPWQIANERHLSNVRYNMAAGRHFLQTADIDIVSNKQWTPIGIFASRFRALYDGDNRIIIGLSITNGGSYCGLFGAAENAVFRNMQIDGAAVTSSGQCVAVLCGWATLATFGNIRIQGAEVACGNDSVAILCGYASGTEFSDCVISEGNVRATNQICSDIGALVGSLWGASQVLRCQTTGVGVAGGESVGGLVGNVGNPAGFRDCQVTDHQGISGTTNVGGLVGLADTGGGAVHFTNCHVASSTPMEISGQVNVGGLVGYYYSGGGFLSGCSFIDVNGVKGVGNVGGLVGNLAWDNIEKCRVNAPVTGSSNVGGLAGRNTSNIFSSIVGDLGQASSISGTNNVGGLVGWNSATIQESGVLNNVSVSGQQSVGGAVGTLHDVASISRCFSQAAVSCSLQYAGGLVGGVAGVTVTIQDCYATGQVYGGSTMGGLVGVITNASSFLACYATGSVENNAECGAFIGFNASTTFNGCHVATNTAGASVLVGNGSASGITGHDSADMMNQVSYDGSWSFGSIWSIVENSSYPFFVWQNGDYIP